MRHIDQNLKVGKTISAQNTNDRATLNNLVPLTGQQDSTNTPDIDSTHFQVVQNDFLGPYVMIAVDVYLLINTIYPRRKSIRFTNVNVISGE